MKVVKLNQNLRNRRREQHSTDAVITSTGRTINFNNKCMAERYVCACISEK